MFKISKVFLRKSSKSDFYIISYMRLAIYKLAYTEGYCVKMFGNKILNQESWILNHESYC